MIFFLKYPGSKGVQRISEPVLLLFEVFQLISVGAGSKLFDHQVLVTGKAQRNIVLRMKGAGRVRGIFCWNFYYTRMSEGMKDLKEEREEIKCQVIVDLKKNRHKAK